MKTKCLSFTILLIAISVLTVNGLYEDDYCTNSNGHSGVCKLAENCDNLRDLLNEGLRPTICGFPKDGRYPIICCPSGKATTTTEKSKPIALALTSQSRGGESSEELDEFAQIARKKCEEYGKLVVQEIQDPVLADSAATIKIDQCGRVAETMIVGGTKAAPREFPHMAMIGYRDPPEFLCGGSLISERFILSAAHCSRPKRKGTAKWVKLGELDTASAHELADPEIYSIIQVIDHPQYDEVKLYNDVSLYKLDRNAVFNEYVRPICLNYKKELDAVYAVASGWGHEFFGGSASTDLLKVSLDLVSNEICNSNYSSTIQKGVQLPQGIIKESMVCAGNSVEADTCQGDSGGPLQLNLTDPYCMYEIIGVTSFGRGCAWGFPGIYSRVSHFLPWIVQNVWPEQLS